jgi:putative ABC transport system permease protein
LPGVQAAGITNFLPAEGATLRYQVALEGEGGGEVEGKLPVGERTVSPGYLQALEAPLLAGVWCPELRTDPNAPPKAMVNRRFVETYAPGQNLVGRHLRFTDFGGAQQEIVGVLGDLKEDTVAAPAYPYVYVCATGGAWPDPDYVVRTAGDPRGLLAAIRQVVRRADTARAVFGVETLEQALSSGLERPRSNARLLGAFALAALLLAAVGLYGLIAQMVSARRQEIGIRMALGADGPCMVASLVVGAVRLAAAGIAAGCALMLAAQPALRALLYGVSALDAWNLMGAAVVLALAAGLAAWAPARRAAAIDPVEALRAE